MGEFARYVDGIYVVCFNGKKIVSKDLDKLFSKVEKEYLSSIGR